MMGVTYRRRVKAQSRLSVKSVVPESGRRFCAAALHGLPSADRGPGKHRAMEARAFFERSWWHDQIVFDAVR